MQHSHVAAFNSGMEALALAQREANSGAQNGSPRVSMEQTHLVIWPGLPK
jgi:hypothetical protein